MAMKADESAHCAGSCGSRLRTGLRFSFFLGPRNRKTHLKTLGVRLGQDLVILSKGGYSIQARATLTNRNSMVS